MSLQVEAALGASLKPGSPLLLALSGGADSVVLAYLSKTLPYAITLGHVNHQLRSGSNADERFVTRLAKEWDLPLRVARVDVRRHAKTHGLGIEEAARALRYQALGVMAKRLRASAIVTAHHADDQAETVLFNFLRGSGPVGLAGMSPARPLGSSKLLRPLLSVSRDDLIAYARAHGLAFRKDPSNNDVSFTRNRLRHQTLPSLAEDFPGLAQRLPQMAAIFRAEEDFWQSFLAKKWARAVHVKGSVARVDLTVLLGYHQALGRRILRTLLPGVSFQDMMRLMTLAKTPRADGGVQLGGGFFALKREKWLVLTATNRQKFPRGLYEQS